MNKIIYKIVYFLLCMYPYLWGTLYYILAKQIAAIESLLPKPIIFDSLQTVLVNDFNALCATMAISTLFFTISLILSFFLTVWTYFSEYRNSMRYYIIIAILGYTVTTYLFLVDPYRCCYIVLE